MAPRYKYFKQRELSIRHWSTIWASLKQQLSSSSLVCCLDLWFLTFILIEALSPISLMNIQRKVSKRSQRPYLPLDNFLQLQSHIEPHWATSKHHWANWVLEPANTDPWHDRRMNILTEFSPESSRRVWRAKCRFKVAIRVKCFWESDPVILCQTLSRMVLTRHG